MTTIHPDAVRQALKVFEFWGGPDGPDPEGAMRKAITSAQAWMERWQAEERAHGRRREEASRHAAQLADIAEARRRAQVRSCERCADEFTPEGTER